VDNNGINGINQVKARYEDKDKGGGNNLLRYFNGPHSSETLSEYCNLGPNLYLSVGQI